MKYDKGQIMKRAWDTYHDSRRHGMLISFSECLRKAWASAKAAARNSDVIKEAKGAAGIAEEIEVKTWYQWKTENREVIHGSKAAFKAVLEKVSQPGKVYTASFFTASQTTTEPQEPKVA